MTSTDHNLLVGALALQLEFIGRDALVRAVTAWTNDRSRPLGEVLIDHGLDRERHDLLIQLAREQARAGADRALASLPAIHTVKEDIARCNDPELNHILSTVGPPPGFDPSAPDTFESTLLASRRFHVRAMHARGGLGQVMVATDNELQRDVALKEIQPQHADDPDSRARFVLEAEITGRLEHPGIVPVYSLGRSADGRPFYVMRFIRGESLEEAIKRYHEAKYSPNERALAVRALLRRFIDVCNTIAYAHARGVLHRDIKPANVMLGEYGETLVVDWGLARTIDRPDSLPRPQAGTLYPMLGSDSGRTQAGSIMGTPPYMSPEQADGKLDELGPASDVYSLGATLYQLLVGKPPLEGDVREVLRRARQGDFTTPRKANPTVPPRLEAVVLKAMALRPQDRYATPAELADEVERWLADLPLRAFREPILMKLGRWSRRHRTLVTVAIALLLTTTLGLAIGLFLLEGKQRETNVQRLDAIKARADADAKAKEAEKQRSLALATLRDVVEDRHLASQQTNDEPADLARIEKARVNFLREAISRLEQLRGSRDAEEALLRAHLNLGELLREEQPEEAARAFEQARQTGEPLLKANPTDTQLRRDLWQALTRLGEVNLTRGRATTSLPWLKQALETARPLQDSGAGRLDGLRAVQSSQMHLGQAYREAGRLMDAAGSYLEAATTAGKLVEYNAPGGRRDRAMALQALGAIRLQQGETVVAVDALLDALNALQSLSETERSDPRVITTLARTEDLLSQAYRKRGEQQLAQRSADRARALYEQLGRENRDNIAVQRDLSARHEEQARAHEEVLEYERASELYGKAVEALEELQKRGKLSKQAALVKRLTLLKQKKGEAERITRAVADLEWVQRMTRADALPLYVARTRVLARRAKHDEARRTAEALIEAFPENAEARYRAACCYALCVDGIAAGRPLEKLPAKDRKRCDELAREAMANLERARDGGYFREPTRVLQLSSEADLKSLMGRADFKRFRGQLIEGK